LANGCKFTKFSPSKFLQFKTTSCDQNQLNKCAIINNVDFEVFQACIHEFIRSRLTGSELQGQEEAAHACPAYTITGVLFTGTSAVNLQAL